MAGADQAGRAQRLPKSIVEFVAVAVAFGHHILAVGRPRQTVGHQPAGLRAEAHGAAEIAAFPALLQRAVLVGPFGDQGDDRMRGGLAELGAVRVLETGDVTGEFDHRHLHAQTDAEIGNPAFAGMADSGDFALDPPFAEAAGHQDGVHVLQASRAVAFDLLGIDVVDIDLGAGMDAAVQQRFV